ncbi:MAG: hypothetical protein CSA66_02560 [Proteobacteria bacterium]|nr:MAG: hypothetical protein CSA66_02560 [Pseudomonadota bacterium]
MRVACVQFKADKGDKAGSLARLRELACRAGQAHPDLVILPEMAATGYLFADRDAVDAVAEQARGDTLAALAPVAKAHGVWLLVGLPERDADKRFNSALVIDPAGELRFTYRKTLLYEADHAWCDPGDSGYRVFETDGGAFTPGICMDLNDDAFIAWCGQADVGLAAILSSWLDQGAEVWGYWAWRIAPAGGVPIAVANTWGAEGDIAFRGESAIISGRTLLAAASRLGDQVIVADVPAGPLSTGPPSPGPLSTGATDAG